MICSHWSVPDRETAKLVADFVVQSTGELANRGTADYARALRDAKLSLLKSGVKPKAWAPLVLIGPPTSTPRTTKAVAAVSRN